MRNTGWAGDGKPTRPPADCGCGVPDTPSPPPSRNLQAHDCILDSELSPLLCGDPVKRGTPVPRSTPLRPGKPPTRSTPLRAKGGHRFPKRVHKQFRIWLRAQRCVIPECNQPEPVQVAHVRSRGAGGTDLGGAVSLCAHHHALQHQLGIHTFQREHGIDLWSMAGQQADEFRLQEAA